MKEEPVKPKSWQHQPTLQHLDIYQDRGGREGDNKLQVICVIYSEYSAL